MIRTFEQKCKIIGVVLTLVAHGAALCLVCFTGLTYIYPPPPESTFVLDFSEEEDDIKPLVEERQGRQPQAEEIDLAKPVELVQKSQSPEVSQRQNLTPATKQDPHGDVEVPSPEQKEEPKLDPRASFPGMAKKDTTLTAPHSASEASDKYKAGQAAGNTQTGKADGKPNAHLKGRNTVGQVARPSYASQESGTVVVTIWVDNYGNVTKAVPGADGTTVTDKTLWNAARNAAMDTHFTQSADAPALQEGTITYIFNLK